MGKCGPCRHCGVTSTPLWRNGPPDKPVLCNACGSRWRTKGSLANYTPLHAREAFDIEESKVSKVKNIPAKPKEQKFQKKRQIDGSLENEHEFQYCDQNFQKVIKGDTSNRSSAGSAVSYSESYFGTESDLTGSAQSNVWDSLVPSRKRTFLNRSKSSAVEKLAKDLCSIWQEQQSSNISGYSEDDLLYESGTPLDSFEIGYGSLLIRNPNCKSTEEESEASSLPVDKSSYIAGEAYSGPSLIPVNSENKVASLTFNSFDKIKKPAAEVGQLNSKRDNIPHELLRILQHRDFLLHSACLNDVANFEGFLKYLTHEEQQQLMKYLPSIDTCRPPESIKSMFKSPQFFEAITYFQQLLQEGTFDLSFSGANLEDSRMLKRHLLHNLKKSEWVQLYTKIKDKTSTQIMPRKESSTKPKFSGVTKLIFSKRTQKSHNNDSSDIKDTMRSPKRVCRAGPSNASGGFSAEINTDDAGSKLTDETNRFKDKRASFSPRNLFTSSPDRSFLLAPFQFTSDSSDHDILLDVPRGSTFAEAELLCHPWKEKTAVNTSPGESVIIDGEESLSSFPTSSSAKIYANHR